MNVPNIPVNFRKSRAQNVKVDVRVRLLDKGHNLKQRVYPLGSMNVLDYFNGNGQLSFEISCILAKWS